MNLYNFTLNSSSFGRNRLKPKESKPIYKPEDMFCKSTLLPILNEQILSNENVHLEPEDNIIYIVDG